ncbi:C-type lectin domain family 17, member A-like [Penaeus chinensis]|uniref:C-type lectin domain family 17, member A-like n=1 Tax=Penaeus chinensis TaxID=139456 RepID=UPI001FB602B6|nr:C-type lectin domain family 17, member A-like [Penaeus chinensis]
MKPAVPFLLALIAVAAAQTECPDPFEAVGVGCYYISEASLTRAEAEAECASLAPDGSTSDLAVLSDCHQHGILWNHLSLKWDYWLGGSDEAAEGDWRWASGDEILRGAPFWFPGQPNGGSDENYLSLSKSGYFADEAGSIHQGYICQLM